MRSIFSGTSKTGDFTVTAIERKRKADLDDSSRVGVAASVVDIVAGCASRLVSWRQDSDSFLPERTSPH